MSALEGFLARDDVADAFIKNLKAEARKYRAEELHQLAEARRSELLAESIGFDVDRDRLAREAELVQDYHARVLPFVTPVSDDSVRKAIFQLNTWVRIDKEAPIEIIFSSPGGSVVPGLALFDHITYLIDQGAHINTVANGMAASMAGILLQAGEKRIMGRESWLMIHEVSFGAVGKIGEVEDTTEWVKAVQKRVKGIFLKRSQGKLSAAAFERGWKRKDWWLDSDEALALGLVDEIR